jgi:hypothetical protein
MGQPWVDDWPLFEEACSKFPVLADIEVARLRLARKFNRALPKEIEIGAQEKAVTNFPLVRGGKIPPAALRWLAEVERVFPGAARDIITIRTEQCPTPVDVARGGAGKFQRARGSENE